MTADGIGGVWTYALDLARGLGDLGIEVILAVLGRQLTAAQHREAWAIPTLSLLERPLKLEWMEEPWDDVARTRAWLLELEREHAPDIVHLHGYSYATAPFRAPKLLVAHSCVLSWWRAVHGTSAPPAWSRYHDAVEAGLRAADSVVAPTRAMLAELASLYRLAHPGVVIVNGTDLSRYLPADKEPLVFSAGRLWDEAKNLTLLARVAPRLAWPVIVAGDDQRPRGTSTASAVSSHAIRALGPLGRGEMASWLGRAAIYAHPARYEPFGLTVLEAAASGCALVLSDIPSLRELWDGAAEFVAPDDEDGLAAAIARLAGDAQRRAELSRAAVLRAERYGLDRFRDTYLEHYRGMLGTVHSGLRHAPAEPVAPTLQTGGS